MKYNFCNNEFILLLRPCVQTCNISLLYGFLLKIAVVKFIVAQSNLINDKNEGKWTYLGKLRNTKLGVPKKNKQKLSNTYLVVISLFRNRRLFSKAKCYLQQSCVGKSKMWTFWSNYYEFILQSYTNGDTQMVCVFPIVCVCVCVYTNFLVCVCACVYTNEKELVHTNFVYVYVYTQTTIEKQH